ncbi:MAG: metal ABC transporter permease [Spirochaetes bacterium]|nr:metal ABC transporter permease [Spirochaetota bacterium]
MLKFILNNLTLFQFFADFFDALTNYNFLQYSFFSLFFVSLLSSTIGTYTVINRQTYIAGAISHGVLGGIGLFNYIYKLTSYEIFNPFNGGLLFTIIYSIIIERLINKKNERVDSILSIIWSLGMAVGIFFIFLTPGYNQEIQKYLFGNILLLDKNSFYLLIFITLFIIIFFALFFNILFIFGFDEELLKIKKIKVSLLRFLVILSISLTVFLLIQIVGILLIIALFTLPAMIALNLNKNLKNVIIISFIVNIFASYISLFFSYNLNLPFTPIFIIFMSILYFISLLFKN